MRRVLLDTGLENHRVAWLRPPTGADEFASAGDANLLLDRCLVSHDESAVQPGMVRGLPLSDRDRLLVAMHRMLFGDHIEADVPCSVCGEPFSLRFTLTSLLDAQPARRPADVDGPDAAGHYRLAGITFRLPASADLDAVLALAEQERAVALLRAVVISGEPGGREQELEEAMAALGPTLDIDLDATCPHCENRQQPRFSMLAFLQKQLAQERRFLLREVHRIAHAYGWSFDSILAIPRRDRHELVSLIDDEQPRVRSAPLHAGLAS